MAEDVSQTGDKPQGPIWKAKSGLMETAIFEKTIKTGDKRVFEARTTTLKKSYIKSRDSNGEVTEWGEHKMYFNNASEIDKAMLLLAKAKEFLADIKSGK